MIGLTSRQSECLSFIEARSVRTGASPSYAEMASSLGYAYKSTIHSLVNALEERGRIRRLPNRARAIEVIQPAIAPRFRGEPLRFISIHDLPSTAGGR